MQYRTYNIDECVYFRRTKEQFGGLSNMASGFPLEVNGVKIRTSEALYQACRFPHLPEVQKKIIAEKSPMAAKFVARAANTDSRSDWFGVNIKIMRWCLQVKLAQNWDSFGSLLLSTETKPIVEHSTKDVFWAAKMVNATLVGGNVLGRLLMELRGELWVRKAKRVVEPLNIPDFLFYGEPIGQVCVGVLPPLEQQVDVRLTPEEAENLTRALKKPPKPTPGLARALKRKR